MSRSSPKGQHAVRKRRETTGRRGREGARVRVVACPHDGHITIEAVDGRRMVRIGGIGPNEAFRLAAQLVHAAVSCGGKIEALSKALDEQMPVRGPEVLS